MVFLKNELCVIVDCTYNDVCLYVEQGIEIDLYYLYDELFDTYKGTYMFSKWEVEKASFLNKLKNMSSIMERKLVNAIKNYWIPYICEGIEYDLEDWAQSEITNINGI